MNFALALRFLLNKGRQSKTKYEKHAMNTSCHWRLNKKALREHRIGAEAELRTIAVDYTSEFARVLRLKAMVSLPIMSR